MDVLWARIDAEVEAEFGPLEEAGPGPRAAHPWRRGIVRLTRRDARRIGRDLRRGP
jgi:hypothetical protein